MPPHHNGTGSASHVASTFASVATTAAAAMSSTPASGATSGKAAGGAASAAGAPPASQLNPTTFFLYFDVVLLFVVALFVLFALPRMVARFMRASEWFAGCFLRRVSIARDGPFTTFKGASGYSFSEKMVSTRAESTYSSSSDSHSINMAVGTGAPKNPPVYVPAWSTVLPAGAKILSMKLRPGYSLGQVALMMGYFAAVAYAALFDVNLFTSPARLGYVAVSQMPVIYVLAAKNNILGTLLGVGYEKVGFACYAPLRVIKCVYSLITCIATWDVSLSLP